MTVEIGSFRTSCTSLNKCVVVFCVCVHLLAISRPPIRENARKKRRNRRTNTVENGRNRRTNVVSEKPRKRAKTAESALRTSPHVQRVYLVGSCTSSCM